MSRDAMTIYRVRCDGIAPDGRFCWTRPEGNAYTESDTLPTGWTSAREHVGPCGLTDYYYLADHHYCPEHSAPSDREPGQEESR